MKHLALVGAPNAGKTTLFNRLTGLSARVGNYPGITVERRAGTISRAAGDLHLVDLPGTYSLAPRSEDEAVALRAILGLQEDEAAPDVLIVVVDATQLPRSLYLVAQLMELARPFVVALSMLDLVERGGASVDLSLLAERLQVPVVDARDRGALIDSLDGAAAHQAAAPGLAEVEDDARDTLRELGRRLAQRTGSRAEAATLGAWVSHAAIMGTASALGLGEVRPPIDAERIARVIEGRHERVTKMSEGIVTRKTSTPDRTESIDRVVLNPALGPLLFLLIFFCLFAGLFSGAEPLMDAIDTGMGALRNFMSTILPTSFPLVRSLILDGVIAGVGNVVVFVPQIAILFLFLGLLEDSGYLARAAFLLDRLMLSFGLSGRAFVPLLSGFACAVPAILATRTLANPKDRLLTILVTPLVSCSARLPVYALMISTVFAGAAPVFGFVPVGALLMIAMYLLSIVAALGTAALFRRTLVKAPPPPLVLELPLYRAPRFGNVLRETLVRVRIFLVEAGTVILAITVVLWALFTFPLSEVPATTAEARATQIEQSIAGQIGKAIEPVVEPLGYDWKIGVGLIASFAAREVLVSTLGLVYGLGEVDDESVPLRESLQAEVRADGSKRYTPLVGLSLMVFFVLAMQCMSTLAAVKRETRSWRWPLIQLAYMTLLAYCASLLVYQGGLLLGFT